MEENIEIDMDGLEEARYQEILNSGKYAELRILIGTEKEKINGVTGVMPCVRLELHDVSSETISILYSSLVSFQKHLEDEYPAECFVSKLLHKTTELGSWDKDNKSKDKKE